MLNLYFCSFKVSLCISDAVIIKVFLVLCVSFFPIWKCVSKSEPIIKLFEEVLKEGFCHCQY